MRELTTEAVEGLLIENLQSLRDALIRHGLDCTNDQAVRLLHKYETLEEDILMLMPPLRLE